MIIKVPIFLYNHYNKFSNMEYELEWIMGYCDRMIFKEDNYKQLKFDGEFIEIEISDESYRLLLKVVGSDNNDDIESAVLLLYLTLYSIGGTN